MKLRMKLAALAVAGGTAALVLAGAPALASSQAPSKAITGPEIAYGAVYGKPATANNPTIPVAWRGLVNTHGVFSTGSGGPPKKGQQHTFITSAGNLTVVVTATPTSSQSFSLSACHFSFTTYVVFAVVGGQSTGKFAGTSGPGAVQVYFAGYGPRYTSGSHKGQCNTSPNAPELVKGAVASFVLSAVLTTP
jgi:hypothetical protein